MRTCLVCDGPLPPAGAHGGRRVYCKPACAILGRLAAKRVRNAIAKDTRTGSRRHPNRLRRETCKECGRALPEEKQAVFASYCNPACRQRRQRRKMNTRLKHEGTLKEFRAAEVARVARWKAARQSAFTMVTCPWCGREWPRPTALRNPRTMCSDDCKLAAKRARALTANEKRKQRGREKDRIRHRARTAARWQAIGGSLVTAICAQCGEPWQRDRRLGGIGKYCKPGCADLAEAAKAHARYIARRARGAESTPAVGSPPVLPT